MTKEFDENKHPRDKDGKFTDGVGTNAEQEKLKSLGISMRQEKKSNLSAEEKRLQELTGEKADKELTEEEKKRELTEQKNKKRWQETWSKLNTRQKRQVKKLLNVEPIQLDIGEKVLNITFNKITIGKNLKKRFKSDWEGFSWKRRNIHKFPQVLTNLKYIGKSRESGKDDPSHYGVKQWHYLEGEYTDKDTTFHVVANIADKGGEQFLYELVMNEKSKNKK